MKKLIFTVLVVAALNGAWWQWGHKLSNGTTETEAKSEIVTVELGTLQSLVTAQGTLEPKNYVDVGAQVSGLIEKMHVDIGQNVKEGELIAEIDPDVYEAQVRADKARLKTLEAQRAELTALIKQAHWKYERNSNLYKAKAVSKEVMQDAQISLDIAKANMLALEAQIEEAQSTLEGDETNLNYTKIYAPMAGTVVSQSVQEGQTINANQTAPVIVQIANLDVMTAVAQVAEADIMKIEEGMKMYFTTLGSGERRWSGTIRRINPSPEVLNDVVLYNVLVDVPNKDLSLLPGMTTQMFFVLEGAENVPILPLNALRKPRRDMDNEHGTAFEVGVMRGSSEEIIVVHTGVTTRTDTQITSGLEVGEKVIIQDRKVGISAEERQEIRNKRRMGRL